MSEGYGLQVGDRVGIAARNGSTLGQTTARLLRARLREVWPSVRGENLLGLGYATPFLRPFVEEAQRTLAFMPAQQGVTRWPREGRNLTTLVDEVDLPLPDRSVDRVLLVKNGVVEARQVKAGRRLDSERIEVVSGLEAGEQFILQPNDRLAPGQKVRVAVR